MSADEELMGCPVCDRMIDPEATFCPGCGTDFTIYGMEELKQVVRELSRPTPAVQPETPMEGPPVVPVQPVRDERPKKGILSKLFRRR